MINRDVVVRTALAIIDEVGLEDFGLERLAADLKIRAPSLYYHFDGRSDILTEVARLVTLDVKLPRDPADARWEEWFVEIATRFRRSVLRHPNAAPLLVQYFPRRFTLSAYERGATLLQRAGVPAALHVMIFEGLDDLAFGSALISAVRNGGRGVLYPEMEPELQPNLHVAVEANAWTDEELFRETVRSFIRGAVAQPDPRSV